MRFVLALAGALLFTTAAHADGDWSLRVELGSGSTSYAYGTDWYWGDDVIYGNLDYRRSGLYVGYDDRDWGARFRSDGFGTHPNDRGGFRVFIPRGLEGPPELYGDYVTDEYGYPIRPRSGLPQYSRRYYPSPHYANRRGYVTVIPYTYGYTQYQPYYPYYGRTAQPQRLRLYTAPSTPELGYYGPVVYRDWPAPAWEDPAWDAGQPDQQVNVQGDVNVYQYYGEQPAPSPSQVQPPPSAPAPTPPREGAGEPVEAGGRAFGVRFAGQVRLETPDGVYRCEMEGTSLFVGQEEGPREKVSGDVDPSFGGFAAYDPALGMSVIFRQGDEIVVGYPTPAGDWWIEPLPWVVAFDEEVTIGMVGGAPWVVFSDPEGTRRVVRLAGQLWEELGSGTSG